MQGILSVAQYCIRIFGRTQHYTSILGVAQYCVWLFSVTQYCKMVVLLD